MSETCDKKSIKAFKYHHWIWVDVQEIFSVNVDKIYPHCVVVFNVEKTQYAVIALSKYMITHSDCKKLIRDEEMLKNYRLYVCRTNFKTLVDDFQNECVY